MNGLVIDGILIVWLLIEPVSDTGDSLSNVGAWWLVSEVRCLTTLVKVWSVEEVPGGLVTSSLILDCISKDGTLDKWVILLLICQFWIAGFEDAQNLFDISHCLRTLLLEDLLSNSCDDGVSIETPGVGAGNKCRHHSRFEVCGIHNDI
jgi:hypothetical protein